MEQYLAFAILGLGAGAISAGLGVGLVMTYKGAGIINFAHAALAMWGAFAFAELRKSGDLVLPAIGRIPLGGPLPGWLALITAVLLAALLGAATQLLVFRPLRRAPLIAKIIASLGLMTLLQNLVYAQFGRESRYTQSLLPSGSFHLGQLDVRVDRLFMAIAVLAVAAIAAQLYRRTLFGLATRAGLEDEAALTLSRWSPTWLAVANVAAGISVSALILILAAPISPLNPDSIPLLVVPGLAAMLVGRLTNVTGAAAGGLALGVLQAMVGFLQTKSWWPTSLATSGLTDAIPLIVIVALLVFTGRTLPNRSALASDPLPRVAAPMRVPTIGIICVVVAIIATLVGPTTRLGINGSIVYAILALSLVILVGLVGQISLGQLAISAVSALALVRYFDEWPFPFGLIAASCIASAIAVIVGLPALRVRGAQLAVVTLAGAAAVQSLAFSKGDTPSVAPPRIGGLDLAAQQGSTVARLPFTFMLIAVLLVICVVCSRIINGTVGRRFRAVRDNEQAAASVGISVAATKVLALSIAGLIAGLGGGLLAYNDQSISGASFSVFASISLLVYAYLGGITSIGGALYAGVLAPAGLMYAVLSQQWNFANTTYETIAAVGLILTAIFYQNGFADAARVSMQRFRRRNRAKDQAPKAIIDPILHDEFVRTPLAASNITVRYGGNTAVDDVSIEVNPGEIVGLIGPNGAGKTSLLDALTGFAPAQGTVTVGRQELADLSPHRRFRAGLARTWQAGQLFEDLTVFDNVRVAAPARDRGRNAAKSTVAWAMHLVGIEELGHKLPSEISGGQRKLVGLARALAGAPGVLLADEPAAGLDSFESRQLGAQLRSVAAAGVGVLLIEHDLALILSICDHIFVLDQGRLVAAGTPEEIRVHPAVLRAYIGEAPPQEVS